MVLSNFAESTATGGGLARPKLRRLLQNMSAKVFSLPSLFAMISGTRFRRGDILMRTALGCAVLLCELMLLSLAVAQQASPTPTSESAICAFEDGKQLTAHYTAIPAGHSEGPPIGKVLIPGGSAMTFFTETDLGFGDVHIPTGGYTMYLIPGKKEWTLIVSKNTAVDAKYDEKQDLARASMATGQLSSPADRLAVYFGHTGPKKCEINIDFGKTRGWVEFREK
ncbi:MAG: hypothetical protein DMG83_05240 [Acidobacteria bacterium]|nr:MAG: hypothetical protein DMG83_05240 [Acidobacteriota bacterium]